MKSLILLAFLILSFNDSHAQDEKLVGGFTHRMAFSLSLTSLSLSETSNNEPGSFSGTAINLGIEYPFVQSIKREFYIKTSVPIASESGTGLYAAFLGMNNYSQKLSAPYRVDEGATSLTIRPKSQYYWGVHTGAGSAIYTIDTAKKSDFNFLIGGQVGMTKQFTSPWGIKGEISLSKGFGMNSELLSYSLGGGVIYDLE